jgi:hypothetical protein
MARQELGVEKSEATEFQTRNEVYEGYFARVALARKHAFAEKTGA